jgi:hypothetical protein
MELVKPVFVFGCCNSGTTILWNAIKNHKDLVGPDIEGQDLEELPSFMKHHLGNSTFRMWAHHLFAQRKRKNSGIKFRILCIRRRFNNRR